MGNWFSKKPVSAKVESSLTFSERDMVVLVIGPSGTGRSTFINTAAKDRLLTQGTLSLAVTTEKITPVLCTTGENSDRRLVLLDTPPYPDENLDNSLSGLNLVKWVNDHVVGNKTNVGIVYMYDVLIRRQTGPGPDEAVKYLLNHIPGIAHAVLVTTRWLQAGARYDNVKANTDRVIIQWESLEKTSKTKMKVKEFNWRESDPNTVKLAREIVELALG